MTGEVPFAPALGHAALTPLYDAAISLMTCEGRWRRALLQQVAPRDGETILDVGCGTGTFALMLKRAAPNARVIGLDPRRPALAANLGTVITLLSRQKRDANLRSAWLCSRNYAVGNILVIFAVGATAATRSPWPDFSVGVIMCLLFVSGSQAVYSQVRRESGAAVVG